MTSSTVQILDQAEARRRLASLTTMIDDVDSFKARGYRYELDATDAALYDEIRALEYLLDEG